MDNSFKTLIDSGQEILILLPSKLSLDQVASGLSLYVSILASGKTASIVCSTPMIAEYSRLIGVDKITSGLANKNLVIKLVNYDASNVDKVSYDIEDGQFRLTVSPKTGFKSPTKDQLLIDYSGTSGDLIILIGGTSDSDFPMLQSPDFVGAKIIHLGRKLLEVSGSNLEILSFARATSSTSELLATLLKEGDFVLDPDIATNLLAGIEEGSNNFQDEATTSETFQIFAELLKLGGQRFRKISAENFPKGAIPNKPFNQPQTVNKAEEPQHKTDESVSSMTLEEAEQEIEQDIPPSWSEPKIYTGTSIS